MFKSPGAPGVAVLATIPARLSVGNEKVLIEGEVTSSVAGLAAISARLSVGIADMETSMVGNEKVLTGGEVTS